MINSMTAFSKAECVNGQFIWEIRSINHRYLDIHLKLPDPFCSLEMKCRERILRYIKRGRIDAQLKYENNSVMNPVYSINFHKIDAILEMIKQIEERASTFRSASVTDLLYWPGVIITNNNKNTDKTSTHILELMDKALGNMNQDRGREGKKLEQMITTRIISSKSILTRLKKDLKDINAMIKKTWTAKISKFCQELDSIRLHQELAILLTKMDVHEEIERIDIHLHETINILKKGEPSGRRLDFLMQELNREINTLGSKSVDQKITSASIELKVLIDQMREQIQNIE